LLDLTEIHLPNLRTATPLPLDLGPASIQPLYDGFSLLNIPSSLARWLGAPGLPHPALDLPELDSLSEGARQIILVLIDAVSLSRFQRWSEGFSSALDARSENVLLVPLTSIAPSTTSTALTTLWTGRSPAEHGIVGYELFLKEFGLVANMITHSPAVLNESTGLLYRAGFQPESFLAVPTLGTHLRDAGVETYAFLPHDIRHSGLSRMHYRDVVCQGYRSLTDLWTGVCSLAEQPLENTRLIWVYFGRFDWASHHYGPDSREAQLEFEAFMQGMQELLIAHLPGDARRGTLLMLLSDHGQRNTPKDPHYEITHHPELLRHLHMHPTGENRLSYLYPKPGHVEAVKAYFERSWPESFHLLESEKALDGGLYGPGEPATETLDRLGHLIAVSHGEAYLWWAAKENQLRGRHGGFSEEEMVVPLLAARLG
jgi:predicted AlkP superfamily pyrophosphatase or phosphodiesterase